MTRPQGWIPSNGDQLTGPNGNTVGILNHDSNRFVKQVDANQTNKFHGFELPSHLFKKTLQYNADWIDIVYTDDHGDRYMYRARPDTWNNKGTENDDTITLPHRHFDHIYSEKDDQFLAGFEVDNTGQTGLNDW